MPRIAALVVWYTGGYELCSPIGNNTIYVPIHLQVRTIWHKSGSVVDSWVKIDMETCAIMVRHSGHMSWDLLRPS